MQGVPKKLHISSNFSPFVWCRKIINDILLIMFIPVSSKLGGQEVESKSLSSFCHWRCLFGTAFPPPIIPWLGIHFSRGKSLDYPKLEWQFNVLRWSFSNNKVLRCKIQHSWQLIKCGLWENLQTNGISWEGISAKVNLSICSQTLGANLSRCLFTWKVKPSHGPNFHGLKSFKPNTLELQHSLSFACLLKHSFPSIFSKLYAESVIQWQDEYNLRGATAIREIYSASTSFTAWQAYTLSFGEIIHPDIILSFWQLLKYHLGSESIWNSDSNWIKNFAILRCGSLVVGSQRGSRWNINSKPHQLGETSTGPTPSLHLNRQQQKQTTNKQTDKKMRERERRREKIMWLIQGWSSFCQVRS